VLPHKARESLQQLQQAQVNEPPTSTDPPNPPAPDPQPRAEQKQALEAALNKAIELAPQIESLATTAAEALKEKQFADALPHEKKALVLLQSILDELPKQDQQQNPDEQQQNDDQNDKQQQDSQQPDQPPQGNDEKDKQQNEQESQSKDLSKQQAQMLLRKARERERQHREHQKEIRGLLLDRAKVAKDW
jgi:hypothetical protein